LSTFTKPLFWVHQLRALRRWGLAIVFDRLSPSSQRAFFKRSSTPAHTLVLIFPGVGGQRTQFYWMIRAITKKCAVDLLYIHPLWGQTLEEHRDAIAQTLRAPDFPQYAHYIAIGHSRGGLLAKYVLDTLSSAQSRLLCTLATPWKAPNQPSHYDGGLRGWVASKNYVPYLSRLFRWEESGTQQLFQTYCAPEYEMRSVASLFDPIVGDPIYQCPLLKPDSYQRSSHLSIPLDKKTIEYIVDLIEKHTEKSEEI
jgi:hypothetical protein